MKISTRLNIAIFIPALMALVIVIALGFSYRQTGKIQRDGTNVSRIRSSITELNHLVFSYVLYHEERPRQQFMDEHEVLTGLIAGTQLRYPEQQSLLANISRNNDGMADVFSQLVSNYDRNSASGTDEFKAAEDRLVALLLLRSYLADSDAAALRSMVDAEITATQIRTTWLILGVIILTALAVTYILLVTRLRVLNSLSHLRNGAAIIGSGNLEHIIADDGKDEIGEVAGAFNRMTTNLREVTASKAELEREIEERKSTERALRESEERFLKAFHSSPAGQTIAVLPEGRWVEVNQSFLNLLGYPREEVIGHTSAELNMLINSGDRTHDLQRLRETGVMSNETLVRTKTGRILTVLSSAVKVSLRRQEYSIATIIDITERKKAEESARSEWDRLVKIMGSMDDGVCIMTPSYNIEYVNPSLEKVYGPVRGRKCHLYFNGLDAVCPWCNNDEILSGKTLKRDAQTKTGHTFEITDVPFKNSDGSLFKLAVFHDVTERKKMDELKDEFIGMVSHELRTPLTIIIGAIDTAMVDGISEEDARSLMQDACSSAETLAAILENLLELSRFQANRLHLNIETVDLRDAMSSVVKQLSKATIDHTFIVEIPEYISPIRADKIRVARIVYNLAENAIKYSPDGGEIQIQAHEDGESVVVSVTDNGIGISPDDQSRLFRQFERLDTVSRQGARSGVACLSQAGGSS